MQLAIANYKDYQFNFQIEIELQGQSEDTLFSSNVGIQLFED